MAENTEKSTPPPASPKPEDESRDKDEITESATKEALEDGEYEEPPKDSATAPPLPNETAPPLPDEAPPLPAEAPPEEDDGWAPIWEESAQAFYFYNRFTHATQWNNPRVPDPAALAPPPGLPTETPAAQEAEAEKVVTGYNPAIHGSYDPNAWYAQPSPQDPSLPSNSASQAPGDPYAATAAFNRFTGRFQAADLAPENFNDENKSKRQMNAFFDVDAAANSHDGRSLKAERSGKKLSKTELKTFKDKRKAKKEEKRRAWLRD
jgi:hypothetical protein